jgi:hypothetical protein
MNEKDILDQLLVLLESKGIKVRYEPLGSSGGGLCAIKGENFFFVDTQASAAESAVLCAQAVGRLIDIENIFLKPQIRDFIEKNKLENID